MQQEIHIKDGVLYVFQQDKKAAIRIEAITQVTIDGSKDVYIEGIGVELEIQTTNIEEQQLLLGLLG